MTGAQITVVVTVLSALAAVLTFVWRAGQTLTQLVRIDVDHEDRMRELEREAWSSAPRGRRDRERRHGAGGPT